MTSPAATVYFDAELRPNRSLGARGFVALMAGLAAISFGAGIAFVSIGAWPVAGFFGLDVLLVYAAFRVSYRGARLSERIRVTETEIEVRRIDAYGRAQVWRAPAHWLQVRLEEPQEHHSRLILRTHGQSVAVGAFLAPEERATLAGAIKDALGRRRAGPAV
jgi:uncharacterized membrane protein